MSGPLSGLKVLEMANFISGPYAAMLLADLGAEVIKVEMPGVGDPFRASGGLAEGMRAQFAAYNRGKKAITLNVQTESGKEAYRRLAAGVDVIVENFRAGTADRLGIGYERLRETNPRLIYCGMSGMGTSGPYAKRPTYDAIAQAMSGWMGLLTDRSNPRPVGPAMSDQICGLFAAYGVLAALVARSISGQGQRVDLSMLSASVAFMIEPGAEYLMEGEVPGPNTRSERSQSYAFVASDGLPFAVHLSTPPKFWEGLARSAGKPELIEDPRFKTKSGRVQRYEELREILGAVFRTRPRAEWLAILEQNDVPSAPINTIAETINDPQVQHIGMVRTFGQGERALDLVGFPVSFAQTPCTPELPPPLLGEHTTEVLRGLGYADEDLKRMSTEGAI